MSEAPTPPSGTPEDFHRRFDDLRTASGLDARALAARSDVEHSTIQGWSAGTTLPQSTTDLLRVVDACVSAAEDRGLRLPAELRGDRHWRTLLAAARRGRDTPPTHRPAQPLSPILRRVPAHNPAFTGREELLAEIRFRLHSPDQHVPGVVSLLGMGGTGKTQLAVEYVHRYADDHRLIWWVNVENATVAATDLAGLADRLGLPWEGQPELVRARLWPVLAQRSDWLLVYDNVDDPSELAWLRPPSSGKLLITGRSPVIRRLGTAVAVGGFARADSIALLRTRCPRLGAAEADVLAAAGDDVPLAVEQIACFLADTGMAVPAYLDLLAEQPDQAGFADPTVERHPGFSAVVAASRDRLRSDWPPTAALFDRMAFLGVEPLPVASGHHAQATPFPGARAGDLGATARMVLHLVNRGLVKNEGGALQMHRVVHALVRSQVGAEDRIAACAAACELLATADPTGPDSPTTWAAYASLTPHVQAVLPRQENLQESAEYRELVLNVLRYLYVSAQFVDGRDLAERAVARWTGSLGPDHPDTLRAAYALATMLTGSGDHREAHAVNRDTWARCTRVLGPDHPDTLRTASNLSIDLRLVGDHVSACDLARDTLRRRRVVLGEDHPDTLCSVNNLAIDLSRLGDHASARDLHEQTLERYRRVLGEDHPDTLYSADGLAKTLRALGETAAAEDLERYGERRRRALSPVARSDLEPVALPPGRGGAGNTAEGTS